MEDLRSQPTGHGKQLFFLFLALQVESSLEFSHCTSSQAAGIHGQSDDRVGNTENCKVGNILAVRERHVSALYGSNLTE